MNDPIKEWLKEIDKNWGDTNTEQDKLLQLIRIYREGNNKIIARYPSLIIALETEQKALEIIK